MKKGGLALFRKPAENMVDSSISVRKVPLQVSHIPSRVLGIAMSALSGWHVFHSFFLDDGSWAEDEGDSAERIRERGLVLSD